MKKIMSQLYSSLSQGSPFNADTTVNDEKYKINGTVTLFLSVSDNKDRAYVARGKGTTVPGAIHNAIKEFWDRKPESLTPQNTKLDIVTKILPWNKNGEASFSPEKTIPAFNWGVDGLAFDPDLEKDAFTPQEVVAYDLIEDKKLNKKYIDAALDYKLTPYNSSNIQELYKFRTTTWYIDGKNMFKLHRGHRVFDDLKKQDVWNAIQLTKENYFKNVVDDQGKFIYSYFPSHDTMEKKYNLLRHAGTIFSMLQTYELMPDDTLMNHIKKALEYLQGKSSFDKNNKGLRVLVERDTVKLGANALAIIVMTKYTEVTGDRKYMSVMQELADWIKEVQKEDGSFSVHKQKHSTGHVSDFISGFYPGQTILALCKLYSLDGNSKWLDTAERAGEYLITVKNKDSTKSTVHRDHWLLYGLNALYRVREKDMYLNHMFLVSESIMDIQYSEEYSKKEWIGGISGAKKIPKSVPTACLTEGLSQVYELATEYGYEKEAEKLRRSIILGTRFLLQMQLRKESAMHYKRKSLCFGAFHNSFKDINLRNDFTQHNISACIACYQLLD
ncbi:beta-L-arabinofuranosidase domain-containing protein [Virgibacillus sp. CBA3643]|uniref:beta-L-arabinofuranosidase domain-containing protein n=1 Tax=Virgibacillus sp. CBA3643 TaxID=2942278 RepID=UPI0035A27B6E